MGVLSVRTLEVVSGYSIVMIEYPGNNFRYGLRKAFGAHYIVIPPVCRSWDQAKIRLEKILKSAV